MAFDLLEKSDHSGLPQEGFLFEYFDDQYAYTSSKQTLQILGDDYAPLQIKRDKLVNETDMFKTTLTVTVPMDCDVALLFRTWIEESVLFTLYRQHYQDSEAVVLWSGKVGSCKFKGDEAELACTPLYTTMKKLGIKRVYQRSCPHVQYSASCGLDSANWQSSVIINDINGTLITLDTSFPNSYFTGGRISVGNEKRWIMSSSGNTIVLMSNLVESIAGDTAELLPGCQHSANSCRNTFNNYLNNGAFPFIPSKNPFRATLLG